ncbi:MAG: DUF2804 family protein [Polyangiales bacterium]
MHPFAPPPLHLVEAGRPVFGRFAAAPRHVNLHDARFCGLPRALRGLRLKRWQAMQVVSEALFVHLALFDARALTMLQVRIYDRASGTQIFHERLLRPAAFRVATQLDGTTTAYADRRSQLAFTNRVGDGRIEATWKVAARDASEALAGALTLDTRPATHQVACMPLVNGGAMYAHKGLFAAEGSVQVGARTFQLAPGDALALLDQQLGTYPYVMEWDWATAAARSPSGEPLGFNLTRNQCREPERYDECCAWRAGQVAALPPVAFTREQARWRIHDRAGRVDLTFSPRAAHAVKVNALLVESRYHGPLGTFTGHLEPEGMAPIAVQEWFGMGERFWLRC